jgi:Protein of unknown function (DUF2769)
MTTSHAHPLVPDTDADSSRCSCPTCPSKADDDTVLYCSRGLSPLRVRTVGCICTECPVYQAQGLSDGYFCAVTPEHWDRLRRPTG